MAASVSFLVRFESDDEDVIADFATMIRAIGSYMVDNIDVTDARKRVKREEVK